MQTSGIGDEKRTKPPASGSGRLDYQPRGHPSNFRGASFVAPAQKRWRFAAHAPGAYRLRGTAPGAQAEDAAAAIRKNEAAWSDAPPTSAPSTSLSANSAGALSAVTLPP